MHKALLYTAAIAAVSAAAVPATAQVTVTAGKIIAVYGDPSDFVVQMDTNGRCGSNFFHTLRANGNFREMTAVALTAFAMGKTMGYFIVSCAGNRNITSHGFVQR